MFWEKKMNVESGEDFYERNIEDDGNDGVEVCFTRKIVRSWQVFFLPSARSNFVKIRQQVALSTVFVLTA